MRGHRGVLLPFLFVSIALLGCDLGLTTKANQSKPAPTAPGPKDPDAPTEFKTTESGLKYRILRKSDGKKPTAEQTVLVNYRGWLDNGDYFDTSYGTGGQPRSMQVNKVITGWMEGLQLIGEGGMIELEIPSGLAYGDRGAPPTIPPKATLHFLIEMIKVTDTPKPPNEAALPSMPGSGVEPGKVDSDAPEEFTTTESGLKYRIRRKTDGKKPTAANTVKVHYRGWLDNNQTFDSSYDRKKPEVFPLGKVVKGWTEGLQLSGVGGMIELEIPSNLGYGPEGHPPSIPGGATLHFLVEILEVR